MSKIPLLILFIVFTCISYTVFCKEELHTKKNLQRHETIYRRDKHTSEKKYKQKADKRCLPEHCQLVCPLQPLSGYPIKPPTSPQKPPSGAPITLPTAPQKPPSGYPITPPTAPQKPGGLIPQAINGLNQYFGRRLSDWTGGNRNQGTSKPGDTEEGGEEDDEEGSEDDNEGDDDEDEPYHDGEDKPIEATVSPPDKKSQVISFGDLNNELLEDRKKRLKQKTFKQRDNH
ncbi:proline-, glutamic acid- and leucine-rich protein 1-like isoform X2 [Diabrotica virgifera virgifera]|uniref:Proline-, glutamic acid- and leucine-rich protein 1-like isoform X4 n=1 Tax=Diabrotica virgifera virgifera TaxID=50390 RepID=A0A6P7EZY8_DIAVI|nr:proline-, glutamic acid- and leucine-rich protein 1-like isoform X2 [Diabrotica virgifera virgifera]